MGLGKGSGDLGLGTGVGEGAWKLGLGKGTRGEEGAPLGTEIREEDCSKRAKEGAGAQELPQGSGWTHSTLGNLILS